MNCKNGQELQGQVKIVELLPTRVVSFLVQNSAQPEKEVFALASRWATARGLFGHPDRFQVFGFNNPVPCGRELRGYEVWITIPSGYDPGHGVTVKEFRREPRAARSSWTTTSRLSRGEATWDAEGQRSATQC